MKYHLFLKNFQQIKVKRKRDKKNIDENIHRGGDQRLKKNYYN